jgi:hypothetical protein
MPTAKRNPERSKQRSCNEQSGAKLCTAQKTILAAHQSRIAMTLRDKINDVS